MIEVESPLMLTIAQIAQRDGVSKPVVSRRVKRLAADHGLRVIRDFQGRVTGVAAAQYDHLRHRLADACHVQAPTAEGLADDDPILRFEQARKARYSADLAQIELEERRGQLVRVSELAGAMDRVGAALVGQLEALPSHAAELATAFTKDGEHGLRRALKTLVYDVRNRMVADLDAVAQWDGSAQGAGTKDDADD